MIGSRGPVPFGRVAALVGAAAALLTLTACDPGTADPTAAPTTSTAPTPVETLPSEPAPAVDNLVLDQDGLHTPSGLGSLRVGAPVPAVDDPSEALAVFDPAYCDDGGGLPIAAGWDPTFDAGYHLATSTEASAATDDIAFVFVREPGISTAAGIGVGSTEAELLAAYPGGFARIADGFASRVYSLSDADSSITFEVVVESVEIPGYWEGSGLELDSIAWIYVAPGAGAGPIAGSDAFSPCPV